MFVRLASTHFHDDQNAAQILIAAYGRIPLVDQQRGFVFVDGRRTWRDVTFVDGFLGGGSVSLYAKAQGFRVVATDIAERSITIGKALIENSRVRLTREDVLRLAAPSDAPAGRIERDYAPSTFTQGQARFLDRALAAASETTDPAKAALIRLLAVRTALLCHPYAQVRKGTIHRVSSGEFEAITESAVYHYVDGLRLTRPDQLWTLAQQINGGVFQGEGRVLQRSILDVLPEIEADVMYADPPYPGVMSYEKEYKVIDEILEGNARPTSPFTARDGAAMIDGLLERAVHIPIWLLSLGNAVVTLPELEEKMRRLGRETRAIEIKYQHLPAVATEEKKRENREFLVVGWDPEAALLPKTAPVLLGADVQMPFSVSHVEHHVDFARAEAAPSQTLERDALEKVESSLLEERVSGLGDGVAVGHTRLDVPDSVLTKPSSHRGRVRRTLRS